MALVDKYTTNKIGISQYLKETQAVLDDASKLTLFDEIRGIVKVGQWVCSDID